MENFDNEIAEILEVESVEMTDILKEFECWDSLTILSIIALAGDNFNVTLSAADINNATTVGDLKSLIKSRYNESK
jgi:acyl carrier protein